MTTNRLKKGELYNMIGNIYISGQIGSFDEVKGVELIDVIGQVQSQPKAQSFNVYINSEGGFVDVGFDIYNYLKSLNRPITTIGTGIVASIATVIFMAGEKRQVRDNTKFIIHLPWGEVTGTADEVEQRAKQLKKAEDKLMGFYKKSLRLTEEAIHPLLREETWLTKDQLLSLGFTTMKAAPAEIKAFLKTSNKMANKREAGKRKKSFIDTLKAFMGVFNKVVFDAENREVDFYELDDESIIAVGDKANIDGEPAEGEVVMQTGEIYVFKAGVLKEIVEAEPEEEADDEATALKLTKALAMVTAKYKALRAEHKKTREALARFERAQSRYAPDSKNENRRKGKIEKMPVSAALAKMKEDLINKNK